MASTVVGALRVILSADTAEFKSGLDQATKLTGQFSGKLTGLSAQVEGFSKVFGTMFTIGAISAAAAKVLDYAGKIQDLTDKTGLSAESLQEMGYAAKQTGAGLEGFTNAAFKLGTNLADGTSKVQGAAEALGLSYDALKAASPDEQFRQTAIALSKVENVQERNRLGVVLMGKAYKEVAGAINQGYDDLARKAPVASAAQIKALADAGDEWDAFKDKVLNLGVILGASFARAMESNITAFKQDAEFLNKYVGIVRITQQAVEDWKTIFGIAAQGPPILADAIKKSLPAALANQTLSMDEAEAKAKELDAQIEKSIETNKAAAKAAEEFAKALKSLSGADAAEGAKEVLKQLEALGGPLNVLPGKLEEMANKLRDGAQAALLIGKADLAGQYTLLAKKLDPIVQFQQRFNVTIGDYAFEAKNAAEMTQDLWEQFYRFTGQIQQINPELLQTTMNLSAMFEPLKKGIKDNNQPSEWAKVFSGITIGLKQSLGNVAQTIAQAFTGGGNFSGAIKSIVSQVGAGIGSAVGSIFGPLGQQIGSAVGSMAGALVPAFKKLFGIGINDELKKFNKEIADSQKGLLDHYGSLQNIDRIGKIVGVDLAAAWKSQGEAGKKHFDQLAKDFEAATNKMVDDAQNAVDDANSALSDLRGELDGAIGAAKELGYEFDKTGKFVGVSFDKAKSTADEFGVSLDGLGPTMRQQGIDAEAKRIINAFTLLDKAAGPEGTGGILAGMKDEIGALVGKSIEMGTTIPANMKPWIQNLIDTHQLLDANGKEITDIGKIKFGDPVKTQFEDISTKIDGLIDKIGELVDKITNELIPALEAATRDRNTHLTYTADPIPQPPGTVDGGGGDSGSNTGGDDGRHYATGTKGVLGNWWGNFGAAGMRATLDNVEAVITPNQALPFAMDVLSRLGAPAQQTQAAPASQPIVLRLDNHINLDGQEMKRWQLESMVSATSDNERGIRTRQRDALGVR